MIEPYQLLLTAAAVLLPAASCPADTLWLGTGDRSTITVEGAKIQQYTDGNLVYTTNSGTQISKPFDQLQQINVDGESNFNAAESAYAAKDYATAISSYTSALANSTKDWVQLRSAIRLTVAGKAGNRFDAETAGYAGLIKLNPAMASSFKPADPTASSANLDAALSVVTKSIDNPKLDSSQKTALLSLQLQINRAQNNSSAANATLSQLAALGSANPSDIATLKLAAANVAYDAKQYTQALNDIDQNRAVFVQPGQQVDALYLLAQIKFAMDGDKTEPDTLKDLALEYMRVVTFGSKLPGRPHVAESLYQTAQIEEKLKEPQAATQLYQQLTRDKTYANAPVTPQAKAALDRLSK